MTLTIVIPVLNEARNLERLLPELARKAPDAEIFVVDGGSRDGSPDVPRRFAGVCLLSGPTGRARQMNLGARHARGEILLFLHADTWLPETGVAEIRRTLADPRVVGGRFDVRFDSRKRLLALVAALMNLRSRLTRICTGDQALFVRRSVFEELGGYADIPLMEDVELSRRLKRRGRVACLRLRVTTSARKWEHEGAVRTIILMWTLRLLYFCGVDPASLPRLYYGRAAHSQSADEVQDGRERA